MSLICYIINLFQSHTQPCMNCSHIYKYMCVCIHTKYMIRYNKTNCSILQMNSYIYVHFRFSIFHISAKISTLLYTRVALEYPIFLQITFALQITLYSANISTLRYTFRQSRLCVPYLIIIIIIKSKIWIISHSLGLGFETMVYAYAVCSPWVSCQIRKIAGCACAGNAGNVFPASVGKRSQHASRHVHDARVMLHAAIAI